MRIDSSSIATTEQLIVVWADSQPFRGALHSYSEQVFRQGFSWKPGSANFYTFGRTCRAIVEVCLLQAGEAFQLQPQTLRAIQVPFELAGEGVRYSDGLDFIGTFVPMPSGQYSLVFENRLNDDPIYLNSSEYSEDVDCASTSELIRLNFISSQERVEPAILRIESWDEPPYFIEGYDSPVQPIYPLLMKDCLLRNGEVVGSNLTISVINPSPKPMQQVNPTQNHGQGYTLFPNRVEFYPLRNAQKISLEAWCAGEINLHPDSVRAIAVPFEVLQDGSGAFIPDGQGSGYGLAQTLAPGSYTLVFEVRLRDNSEYLSDRHCQENISLDSTEEYCCLTFIPTTQPITPEILRF
jgi:hypothetical protein